MSITNDYSPTDRTHAECWNCLGSRDVKEGTLYLYKLRSDAYARNQEIFPAVEPGEFDVRAYFNHPILKQLGYEVHRVKVRCDETETYLTLPDSKLITSRFATLLLKDQNLRPLRIEVSKGIVDDMKFIAFYFNKDIDVVISEDTTQVVHDHSAHLRSHVLAATENPTEYYRERDRLGQMVQGAYDRIRLVEKKIEKGIQVISDKELIKIKTLVALFVDLIWAESSVQKLKSYPSDSFTTCPYYFMTTLGPYDSSYEHYWSKRFPGSWIQAMIPVWHKIMTFDQS
jgi:hypothetical protein